MGKITKPSAERLIQSGIVSHPIEAVPHLEGKLIFFYEWCKNCGICVFICPTQALEENDNKQPFMAHPDKCTYCSLCWKICPDFAIIKNTNWREEKNATE
ncbi:hypothetical protein DRQ33_06295 [bacterium]|nr:MAG: hypothetical protein DRQ33_06295 [bacterium]